MFVLINNSTLINLQIHVLLLEIIKNTNVNAVATKSRQFLPGYITMPTH